MEAAATEFLRPPNSETAPKGIRYALRSKEGRSACILEVGNNQLHHNSPSRGCRTRDPNGVDFGGGGGADAIADALADSGKPQDHMLTPRKRWRGFRKLKSIEMAIAAS